MERKIKRAGFLLAAGALLLSGAVAQQANRNNTISGPVDGEEYFVDSVFFQGVELPEVLDSASGSSSYDLEGEGSVTVGSNRSGGFPRIVILGGTTITSNREHGQEDVNHEWWEGDFFAPGNGRIPSDNEIDGTDSPNGDDIARYIVEGSYEFGDTNEEFSFSPSATFVADFENAMPDNTRLYVATKALGSEDGTYTLNSSEYCWVEDGYCIVDISTAGSFALVREVFDSCPVRNEVLNGTITRAPNCLLECDRGYEPDEERRYCVASEGTVVEDDQPQVEEEPVSFEQPVSSYEESAYEYRPGYFKYRGTRDNFNREVDMTGLSGEEKRVAEKLSVGSLKTVGEGSGSQTASNAESDNDSFLNYLLSFRGKGTDQSSESYSADASEGESEEMGSMEDGNNGDGGTYSSAPLLPSTGAAGIFWVLAALGLGMMAFAVKRK